jgi:hypothetical protein
MSYQRILSSLRHAMLRVQGQDLKQVLLRAAAKRADEVSINVSTPEEIFHDMTEVIYKEVNELPAAECFKIVADINQLQEFKDKTIEPIAERYEWIELRAALLEGLSPQDENPMGVLLDNTHSHLEAEGRFSSTYDIAGFKRILLPLVRRIYADMPVRNLVGFQPMNGPVGLAYTLRYRMKNDDGEYVDAFEETKGKDEIQLEGQEGRQITLDVVSSAVEAMSRKLQAGWTIEAMQDLKTLHDIDIEAEITAALASEIRMEITAAILADIKAIAGEAEVVKLSGDVDEQILNLCTHINRAANEIAQKTRRGAGNWIVAPLLYTTWFKSLPSSVYVEVPKEEQKLIDGLTQVGTLNGCIKVYTHIFSVEDEILVGYKGSSDTDAGYIHCPYIPVMSSGVIVHPTTFQPVVSLMTRYGTALNGNVTNPKEASASAAGTYYHKLKVESSFLSDLTVEDDDMK